MSDKTKKYSITRIKSKAAEEKPGVIVEEVKPLSQSMLWKLQTDFFANQGPEAWIKAIKPADEMEEEGKPWLSDYFGSLITSRAQIEKMIDEYYDEHGWDINTSVPTRNKLEELELGKIADSLGIR